MRSTVKKRTKLTLKKNRRDNAKMISQKISLKVSQNENVKEFKTILKVHYFPVHLKQLVSIKMDF